VFSLLAEICDSALHAIDKALHKLDAGLHKLCLTEETEEVRFRRRLHIHVVMISITSGLSLCAVFGCVSLSVATGGSAGLLCLQELLDDIGRF
jgi:hypothetical protein